VRERLTQGRVALGREQFLLGCRSVIVRDGLGAVRVAGTRIVPSWLTSFSQTFWPTSSASASPSPCRRQIDQISGA